MFVVLSYCPLAVCQKHGNTLMLSSDLVRVYELGSRILPSMPSDISVLGENWAILTLNCKNMAFFKIRIQYVFDHCFKKKSGTW